MDYILKIRTTCSAGDVQISGTHTLHLPDADFYPLSTTKGIRKTVQLTAAERKEPGTYIDLHFGACFPVSPSPEEEKEDFPALSEGQAALQALAGSLEREGSASGSPRTAALGMGGVCYVAEFPPGSCRAAAGDVQDTQSPLQGEPSLL